MAFGLLNNLDSYSFLLTGTEYFIMVFLFVSTESEYLILEFLLKENEFNDLTDRLNQISNYITKLNNSVKLNIGFFLLNQKGNNYYQLRLKCAMLR